WEAGVEHVLKSRSLKEMKRILDDNGMKHVELEFLKDWFLEGERKKQSDIEKEKLFAAAEALNAKHVKVGDFFREKCEMARLIEAFAALCADAAEHGITIGFELMPFAMIDTLVHALTMLEVAGVTNGRIIVEAWHVVKMGVSYK